MLQWNMTISSPGMKFSKIKNEKILDYKKLLYTKLDMKFILSTCKYR